jgi:hypothetical protein
MPSYERHAPQRVSQHGHRQHPAEAAEHAEGKKARVAHAGDPRYERRKRADDRNEPRKDDGLAAVPLIEVLGARDVFLFEKKRVAPREDPRPRLPVQKVSRGVAISAADISAALINTISSRPAPETTTTVNSSESPGRKKPGRSPVSANTTPASAVYPTQPVSSVVSSWMSRSGSVSGRLRRAGPIFGIRVCRAASPCSTTPRICSAPA